MSKVIFFFAKKGGAGKTILNTLFANELKYNRGLNVLVIDSDNHQASINALRKRKLDPEADESTFYDILVVEPTEVYEGVEEYRDSYDYIFVDLVGTTGQKGVTTALTCADHIIVPITNGDTDLISTESLLADVILPVREYVKTDLGREIEVSMILNNIDKRFCSTLKSERELKESFSEHFDLKENSIYLFDNIVFHEYKSFKQNAQTTEAYVIEKDKRRYEDLFEEFINKTNS